MGGEPELCETQKRIRELEIENVFLDKTAVLFVKDRASPRYRFVLEEKGEFPVKLTICVSGVSLTGFCSWFGNGYPQGAWTAGYDAAIRVQLESDRRFSSRFFCLCSGVGRYILRRSGAQCASRLRRRKACCHRFVYRLPGICVVMELFFERTKPEPKKMPFAS